MIYILPQRDSSNLPSGLRKTEDSCLQSLTVPFFRLAGGLDTMGFAPLPALARLRIE